MPRSRSIIPVLILDVEEQPESLLAPLDFEIQSIEKKREALKGAMTQIFWNGHTNNETENENENSGNEIDEIHSVVELSGGSKLEDCSSFCQGRIGRIPMRTWPFHNQTAN
jgi:hypothetical protein